MVYEFKSPLPSQEEHNSNHTMFNTIFGIFKILYNMWYFNFNLPLAVPWFNAFPKERIVCMTLFSFTELRI